jgi:two-component system, response regulator
MAEMDPKPIRVLIVEDTADDERLAMRALDKLGIAVEVDIARDGAEAIVFLEQPVEQTAYRLVLLDLKLPKVSGIEVLETIRSSASTATLPVVVLTSSDERRDMAACYGGRCNAYVRKAVDYTEYMDAMRKTLEFWLIINLAPPSPVSGSA